MSQFDKVSSFSYNSKQDFEAVAKLKARAKTTGISFSFLVLKAIKKLNNETK